MAPYPIRSLAVTEYINLKVVSMLSPCTVKIAMTINTVTKAKVAVQNKKALNTFKFLYPMQLPT